MMKKIYVTILTLLIIAVCNGQDITYAEKLGFPKGSKVLILHVDDVGMSWDSNEGAITALEKGVATSLSIMMPCPWVPGFVHYMKQHSHIDAGLHLTLTSEWKDYRWRGLSSKAETPGLYDSEGVLWASVNDVVAHASAQEVRKEIDAQIALARQMGFEPTHLDSHMGTLFATPQFMEQYLKAGIENKIPVMFPGGHASMISQTVPAETQGQLKQTGKMLWDAGLPVLDDLHNLSYGFDYPRDEKVSDEALRKTATTKYIETIRQLKPGLTMVIMHCTQPSSVFPHISDSWKIRKGDLLAMTDPAFRKFIQDEKIVLTTWREVYERRKKTK